MTDLVWPEILEKLPVSDLPKEMKCIIRDVKMRLGGKLVSVVFVRHEHKLRKLGAWKSSSNIQEA